MRFELTDDQIEFRSAARGLLDATCGPDAVRRSWPAELGGGGGDGRVREAWSALADMGVMGLLLPEQMGGLALSDDDLVALLVEAGRAGLPDPLGATAAVGAAAIAAADHPDAAEWAERLAAGELAVGFGMGAAPLVASAATADAFILVEDGVLYLAMASEVTVEPMESADGGRGLARVLWSPATAAVVAADDGTAARLAVERAAVASAARLVGLSQRMLELTVDYVRERHQFGVPIGSFQAVKHQLADAARAVEFALPLVLNAAHALSLGEDPTVPVSMAKARASTAAMEMAGVALQCHGAIGYTVECDLQLFMKPAWVVARENGDARWHRARVRDRLLTT